MRKTFRRLLVAAIVSAPLVTMAGNGANPPIPDPVKGEPAGFLEQFLEMLMAFVEGLIGGMLV